jgi:hypothetical protein
MRVKKELYRGSFHKSNFPNKPKKGDSFFTTFMENGESVPVILEIVKINELSEYNGFYYVNCFVKRIDAKKEDTKSMKVDRKFWNNDKLDKLWGKK